ncbi:MAG TPA: alpha/beta fold hydrolase [Steroidobacteraceae bacterium]|nr:alpha/beta fold hydrolase [Steroidobacteraceae bacterium]
MPAKRPRQNRENVTPIKAVHVEAANESRPKNGAQDGFAPADNAGQPELEHAAAADAAEQILGANPLLGIDREELLAAGKRLLRLMTINPQVLVEENLAFARELLEIAMGRSKIAADPRDRRFSHVVWQKSGYYKRLMQAFVAWRDMLTRVLDRAETTHEDRERARFVLQLFTETFAPTNSLFGNPGALQRITETRGKSLLYGLQNFVDDLTNNFGMPRQVDERKFQVGKNLAMTPGAVVYRGEVFELIQYAPQTEMVQKQPLLIVPPQINKFYATDLAPGRSFAEFAVRSGVQTFCISWRNPTAAQRDWNVETYLTACKEAISVAREITGAERVNAMAACAGGFTLATLLGHLAAKGEDVIESATLLVTVLDTEAPTMLGQFASRTGVAATIEKSRRRGVLEGSEMARVFAWLRPNDLVWLFVANNWVMGNRPPAFDILYWNSDTTRLPAEFHADLLRMFMDNPLKTPGSFVALGTPIDMSKVKVAAYVVAGITDHITPWQACYQSKNILRGKIDFVLSSSGHIQSIVNPPTNPKAKYFLNSALPDSAEDWVAGAQEHAGSWWDHWAIWYREHGAGEVPAPRALGSPAHPAGDPAPGRYVHQR